MIESSGSNESIMTRPIYLLIFVAFLFSCAQIVSAQSDAKAGLFDSWGRINSEDHSARLDNVATALQNSSGLRAFIICYGPEGESSGSGKGILNVMQDYLVNSRGIDPGRLELIYGGRYKDPSMPRIEVWLVPYGAAAPESAQFNNTPAKLRGKVEEYLRWDETPEVDECGCGPPQGYFERAALADSLQAQASDLVYIVAFSLKDSAPGTWRRVAEDESASLLRYGIKPDRIKLIFGGAAPKKEAEDNEDSSALAKIEIWVMPKDAPPPVKAAKEETSLKRSVLLGEYEQYQLSWPSDQKRVLDRFVDVLRIDQTAILCLIVRPSSPPEEVYESLPGTDQPEDVDTVKLVEKWQAELTKKLGIKSNRIVLIPAPVGDYGMGSIEVWVIPPGAELPKPRRDEPSEDKPDPRTN